jgi:hypothetical protein
MCRPGLLLFHRSQVIEAAARTRYTLGAAGFNLDNRGEACEKRPAGSWREAPNPIRNTLEAELSVSLLKERRAQLLGGT